MPNKKKENKTRKLLNFVFKGLPPLSQRVMYGCTLLVLIILTNF